jgi:hypothetical protein
MLAELEKLPEPERIALRTSAPVRRDPAAPEMDLETSAGDPKPPDSSKWLAGFENDLIDLAAKESQKVEKAAPAKPTPASFPSGTTLPEIDKKNRLADVPKPVVPIQSKVKPAEKQAPVKPAEGVRPLDLPGYPARIIVPETIAMMVVMAGWMMYAVQWMPTKLQTWEMYAILPGTLAVFQSIRCAFRLTGGGYALTPKQIVRSEPKPFRSPKPIDLKTIASVTVEQSPIELVMMAGKLRIKFERDQAADVVLGPVSFPKRRAKLIQDAVNGARQGGVIAARATIG